VAIKAEILRFLSWLTLRTDLEMFLGKKTQLCAILKFFFKPFIFIAREKFDDLLWLSSSIRIKAKAALTWLALIVHKWRFAQMLSV
jgi:hypothetical protein